MIVSTEPYIRMRMLYLEKTGTKSSSVGLVGLSGAHFHSGAPHTQVQMSADICVQTSKKQQSGGSYVDGILELRNAEALDLRPFENVHLPHCESRFLPNC